MHILYTLTPELRIKLKKPLGILIRGSYTETRKRFLDMAEEEKPSAIISVGDRVSKNIAKSHIAPQLAIVDNKVMRRSIQPIPTTSEKTIHVKNPAGTITEEAIAAIQDALKSQCHVKIIVDGEEDLLTLIAVLYAPQNSFVVYGQPYEGIVVVKVTPEKKAEVSEILKTMETARKTK
ncbi:MAG: DUF359 domain-containing protein [Candidatus Bathyarchaeota archaeon]|nr:DUF359 domain-containing protein [Candidatus Bathyarchaeota archaeon]